MWFNPAEITKFAKRPTATLATLATLATYHPQSNAECPKVAEVAEVASPQDSKKDGVHGLVTESDTDLNYVAIDSIDFMSGAILESGEIKKLLLERRHEALVQEVIAMLESAPSTRYAVQVKDVCVDPVIITIGIRGNFTFDLAIPYKHYDGIKLLELIKRYSPEKSLYL